MDARPITDAPGYLISSDGIVYSEWTIYRDERGRLRRVRLEQHRAALRPGIRNGYQFVVICRRNRYVHELVALEWIGPRPHGHDVRHADGNRTNNHVSNLSYGTRKENMADAIAHGTTTRGERNTRALLNARQVVDIRSRLAAGERVKAIASSYGVSHWTIYSIVSGKNWRHVS